MLGRLEMQIQDCEANYLKYCKKIFSNPQWLSLQGFLAPKYSDKRLRKACQTVVGSYGPKPKGSEWKRSVLFAPEIRCKTYAIYKPSPPLVITTGFPT